VRRGEVDPTEKGTPTTKIYIPAEGVEKAYRLYLRYNIELRLGSRNEKEALLGARLRRLAGVKAEARKNADGKRLKPPPTSRLELSDSARR
jgi:hypothetical protein